MPEGDDRAADRESSEASSARTLPGDERTDPERAHGHHGCGRHEGEAEGVAPFPFAAERAELEAPAMALPKEAAGGLEVVVLDDRVRGERELHAP